jgi:ABC-type molybdate transport system ATPase subunit
MDQKIAVTTVYVAHGQSEAMTMGDTVVVMKDSVIQQAASLLEVYNRPRMTRPDRPPRDRMSRDASRPAARDPQAMS